MEGFTLLVWGIAIGWYLARWKEKPPATTWQHEVGVGLAKAVADIIQKRRFVGTGVVIEKRWTTHTKYGEIEVCLTQRDCEQVTDL